MVKFFNQKEDVIDIQLTPYGKRKLAEGEFDAVYYGMYDSDALYDSGYAGIQGEKQNNIVTRLKEETPRLRTQANFTSSNSQESTANLAIKTIHNITDANAQFFRFLGRSSPWSDYAPAWLINNINDSMGFSGNYQFKSQLSIPVFTASLNIEYSSIVHNFEDENGQPREITNYTLETNERLLLDVLELNTIFKGGSNYEIAIFRRMPGQEDNLISLNFLADPDVDSAVLGARREGGTYDSLEGTDVRLGEEYPTLTPKSVEYFLTVRTDSEIEDIPRRKGSTLYRDDFESEIAKLCEENGIPFEDS